MRYLATHTWAVAHQSGEIVLLSLSLVLLVVLPTILGVPLVSWLFMRKRSQPEHVGDKARPVNPVETAVIWPRRDPRILLEEGPAPHG